VPVAAPSQDAFRESVSTSFHQFNKRCPTTAAQAKLLQPAATSSLNMFNGRKEAVSTEQMRTNNFI
jgi:hypothetical protein